jgi:hypothetical protein
MGDVDDFEKLLLSHDDVEVIREKGFNGEPLLEVFISSIQAIAVVASIIIAKINTRKVSKIVIEGKKIELEGVSEELIKEVLEINYQRKSSDRNKKNFTD